MQLHETEKLSLDQTIDLYFPEFPNGDRITIYHLLSHTSGIPNWWGWDGELPKNTPKEFPMCENPHLYIQSLEGYTPLFDPGSHYAYSNSGYVLLGEIIELVSGLDYGLYLDKFIFKPAGMNNTALENVNQTNKNWAKGYRLKNGEFDAPEEYPMPFSAGGLRSTTVDLHKFWKALSSGILVTIDSFKLMTSYASLSDGQKTYQNLYSDNGPIRFPSNIRKFGYGLGFQIVENYGTKVISHGGDIAGFNSLMMFIPKNQTFITILSNTENGIMSKLQKIEKLATTIKL